MIALLLAQVEPPLPPDVVVDALHRMRLSVQIHDARLTGCQVRVTSGQARVDAVGCEATRTCVDRGITDNGPLTDCVNDRIGDYLKDRADRAAGEADQ